MPLICEGRRCAQRAAEETIRDHELITLSARDSRAVMQALLHPEPTGPWLRQAAQRYKDSMGEACASWGLA